MSSRDELALALRRQRQRSLRQPIEPDLVPEPSADELAYQAWQKAKAEELLERELDWKRFKGMMNGTIPKVTTR